MTEFDALQVGVAVTTHYGGRVTRHVITGRYAVSNGRVLLRVDPSVPNTAGLNAWLDAAHFQTEAA